MSSYQIPILPVSDDIETKIILKKSLKASRALAELKSLSTSIPNENILINTLLLQEAKYSSEIENIITTSDEIYKSNFNDKFFATKASKEVHNYAQALKIGNQELKKNNLLRNSTIKQIQQQLELNNAGFRSQSGTTLKDNSGKVIYTPPQSSEDIQKYMANLERFINDDNISSLDSLVKMSIIHHQFESIHPFFDANGRTGRIINILYLIKSGLLDSPVLYLSRYINNNKAKYYELLQYVRDSGEWEEWVLFILEGIYIESISTINTIKNIKILMQKVKNILKNELPKVYSHELLNNIFTHPYTKISFLTQDLSVHTNTASKYLNKLVDKNILEKMKIGTENYYINIELFNLLMNISNPHKK